VVHDGLVYAPEADGYLHCLDAETGKKYWEHDFLAGIRGSPLWADGKVYLGDDNGSLWVFQHGKEKAEPRKIDMDDWIGTTPVFSNGVLYIVTHRTLYAIQQKK
jgi:outer membrane protein assembly factor BamB